MPFHTPEEQGNNQPGPNLDQYTSPYTGRTGSAAYYDDVRSGRITQGAPAEECDLDCQIEKWKVAQEEEAAKRLTTTGVSRTTGQGVTTGRTVGTEFSITQQISRRFFDVPTEEEFLNNFENAFSGFLRGMGEKGLGGNDISLALDPATGLMDMLLADYMGNIAQRADQGEDIYELVGTEANYGLIRHEPGSESVTRGRGHQETRGGTTETGETVSTDTSVSGKPGEEGKVTSTSEQVSTRENISTQEHITDDTRESRFREITEVLARPQIAAVFKFSPTEFLEERFQGDAGELATFIQGRKGERERQRQTLAGAPTVTPRRA